MRLSIQIDRHKRNVSAAGMFALASENVFRKHFHAHLHGSAKHAIHAGFQYDELSYADRKSKIEIIHRCGHHVAVRMAMRRQRPRNIDQMHHAPA